MNLAQTALGLRDYIQSWRRRLHQYPELSLQEVQTTQALAEELDRLGIPVIRFPGHTGLIGVIAGSFPGKPFCSGLTLMPFPFGRTPACPMPLKTAPCMPAATTAMPPCCWERQDFCWSTGKNCQVRSDCCSKPQRKPPMERNISSPKVAWMGWMPLSAYISGAA